MSCTEEVNIKTVETVYSFILALRVNFWVRSIIKNDSVNGYLWQHRWLSYLDNPNPNNTL